MLVDVLKLVWQSILNSGNRPDSLNKAAGNIPPQEESTLRNHLRAFPKDVDKWFRLGMLTAPSRPDLFDAMNRPDRDFWFAITAADLARQAGEWECAIALYDRALTINPEYSAQVLTNMGVLFKELVRLPEAIQCFEKSLKLAPGLAEACYNLGLTQYEVGQIENAEQNLLRAIELKPDFAAAHSTLLCLHGFNRNSDPERVFAEHVRWAELHADVLTPRNNTFSNSLVANRRLTIGYVSADLREHSMRFFIEPVLANHDRQAFQILCYDNWPKEDETNLRLRQYVDGWTKIAQMSDEDVAAQIRADGVDILIDLSGHTTGNRLLVFARKPAPVQATWLGYMCTTGLRTMDYRITDPHLDPPGKTERHYTEKLIRMTSAAAFSPAPDCPAVNTCPAQVNGFVTFGSLNNITKVSDEVIAVWTRLLLDVPSSRLLLIALGGDEPHMQDMLKQRFALAAGHRSGLLDGRINVRGRRPLAQFFRIFHEIDIALDPFPYSGGTTSLHTLWMGVPIITMEGDSELSRSTSGMMRACGLDQLIAPTREAYLNAAIGMTGDLSQLAAIRAGLRARLAASCISDSKNITRELEARFREMWDHFVTAQRTKQPHSASIN